MHVQQCCTPTTQLYYAACSRACGSDGLLGFNFFKHPETIHVSDPQYNKSNQSKDKSDKFNLVGDRPCSQQEMVRWTWKIFRRMTKYNGIYYIAEHDERKHQRDIRQ